MVCITHDPLFERHRTGYHPECPDRIRLTANYLESLTWFSRLPKGRIAAASEEIILRTHSQTVLSQAKQLCEAGGGALDEDTFVCPDSFQVALHSAGSSLAAVDQILSGREARAFCLLRPPGHHATASQSMGFCIFNNIAMAAHYARDVHQLDRILIVDFDVHHGNGTQDIFYADDSVHFLSIHRHPFYPGTGQLDETGTGKGLGATINIPISWGTSREQYLDRFRLGLDTALHRCRPQLILISAGFDAHKDDPIGSLGLELEDFTLMTEWIKKAALSYCQGRIVSFLEGGYNLQMLPLLISEHLQALA